MLGGWGRLWESGSAPPLPGCGPAARLQCGPRHRAEMWARVSEKGEGETRSQGSWGCPPRGLLCPGPLLLRNLFALGWERAWVWEGGHVAICMHSASPSQATGMPDPGAERDMEVLPAHRTPVWLSSQQVHQGSGGWFWGSHCRPQSLAQCRELPGGRDLAGLRLAGQVLGCHGPSKDVGGCSLTLPGHLSVQAVGTA